MGAVPAVTWSPDRERAYQAAAQTLELLAESGRDAAIDELMRLVRVLDLDRGPESFIRNAPELRAALKPFDHTERSE